MTSNGGAAAGEQRKKSGLGGCAGIALAISLLFVVLIVVSCVNNANKPESNPYQYTPTAEPVVSVDSATVSKVKAACEAQLKAIAANSGRKIANVEPKPYEVVSVTFTGEVEEVALPYKEVAWDVPLTATNKFPSGTTSINTETCRFRKLQQDAQMLNG